MGEQRASILDFEDDEDFARELVEVISKPEPTKPTVNPKDIEAVARKSGFTNRQPPEPTRRRRKKSPFTEQLGIKVRPGMKEIFQDLGEIIGGYDHTIFERAILALIKQEKGTEALAQRYEELTH